MFKNIKYTTAVLPFFFAVLNIKSQTDYPALQIALDTIFSNGKNKNSYGAIHIQQGNQILYSSQYGAKTGENSAFTDFTKVSSPALKKLLLHYALLTLVKDGNLALDDNLLKHFPEIKNKHTASKIKISDLLCQASGLNDLNVSKKDSALAFEGDITAIAKQLNEIKDEPGKGYSPSVISQVLISKLIEKHSKQLWFTYVKKIILEPCGMTVTSIDAKEEVYSSLVDTRKFIYALQYHIFLSEELVETSYTPCLLARASMGWNREPEINKNMLLEPGFIDTSSFVCFFPKSDLYIVCFGNFNEAQLRQLVQELYVAGLSGH